LFKPVHVSVVQTGAFVPVRPCVRVSPAVKHCVPIHKYLHKTILALHRVTNTRADEGITEDDCNHIYVPDRRAVWRRDEGRRRALMHIICIMLFRVRLRELEVAVNVVRNLR